MALSEAQKKYLRGLGHKLKPVVMVAEAGLTDAVIAEFETALNHHELIKVRVRVGDRKARDKIIEELCERAGADLVTRIGNVALIYRRNEDEPKITLPA